MVRSTPKVAMVNTMLLVMLLSSSWLLIDGRQLLLLKVKDIIQHQDQQQVEIEANKNEMSDKHHECYRTSYSCWKKDEKVGN